MKPWFQASSTHLAFSYGNTSEIVLRRTPHRMYSGWIFSYKVVLNPAVEPLLRSRYRVKYEYGQKKAFKTSSLADVFYFCS